MSDERERAAGHTPGPWRVGEAIDDRRDSMGAIQVLAELGRIALVVVDAPETPQEQAANARLIAAAPELLAALSGIMRWWMETPQFEAGEDEMPSELFDAARAALAKAKGGAS